MKKCLAMAFAVSLFTVSCSNNNSSETSSTDSTSTTNTVDSSTASTPAAPAADAGISASKNVVENASSSPDHTTLVAAVKAAGLAETLSGAGPFTVFAPTNEAFNKLPAGTVDGLLQPDKKADLTKVLTYHVVPGSYRAADLKDGQKLKTVEGNELTVSIKDGKVMIDGANVTTADVASLNGVIHIIDAVVMAKK